MVSAGMRECISAHAHILLPSWGKLTHQVEALIDSEAMNFGGEFVSYYILYTAKAQLLWRPIQCVIDVHELVPSKIFNPPFPVLKAGHSVSYSCVCDVDGSGSMGWVSFYSF